MLYKNIYEYIRYVYIIHMYIHMYLYMLVFLGTKRIEDLKVKYYLQGQLFIWYW